MNPNRLKKSQAPQINQTSIESILAMRETQRALKDRLRVMDDALDKAESTLIDAIDNGVDLSSIGYNVEVQENTRRYPAWKEHFISRLGKSEADAVMASTPETFHRKLVIK